MAAVKRSRRKRSSIPGLALLLSQLPEDIQEELRVGRYSPEARYFFAMGWMRRDQLRQMVVEFEPDRSPAPAPVPDSGPMVQLRASDSVLTPGPVEEGPVGAEPAPIPAGGMTEEAAGKVFAWAESVAVNGAQEEVREQAARAIAEWERAGYSVPPSSWRAQLTRRLQEEGERLGTQIIRITGEETMPAISDEDE